MEEEIKKFIAKLENAHYKDTWTLKDWKRDSENLTERLRTYKFEKEHDEHTIKVFHSWAIGRFSGDIIHLNKYDGRTSEKNKEKVFKEFRYNALLDLKELLEQFQILEGIDSGEKKH